MNKREFTAGARDTLPIAIGVVPFGIAYGISGLASGLTAGETLSMSLFVFAGAAQFVSLPMFATGAGILMICFTTLLINLRHLLMGISLAPYMRGQSFWRKALLSFGMVDESYAVTISRTHSAAYSEAYQLGSNVTLYITWAAATIGGIIMGNSLQDPLSWGLDFAMPATFLALLVPRLTDKTSLAVCLVAAAASVSAYVVIPGKWYIIIACLVAVMTGGLLDRRPDNAD